MSKATPRSEVVLRVSDMTCPTCETGVRDGLLQESGVLDVSADWQEGTARVTYDPRVTSAAQLLGARVFSGSAAGGHHKWRAQIGVPAPGNSGGCCV